MKLPEELKGRDRIYTILVLIFSVLAFIIAIVSSAGAQALSLLPPPVEAGGAMVVTWDGIDHPTPTDWVGLYVPGTSDFHFIEWIYVGCSQDPCRARTRGTCGFAIPATVPQGTYELRLYARDGFGRLATSPRFHVTNGGGQ